MKIRSLPFLLAFALTVSVRGEQPAPVVASADESTQQLTIVFRDEDAARNADVSVEPLFDGHHRAVSCRWDDNWTSDNAKTREVMEEYGIRGTWYLNDREFSPENKPADYLPIAKELLRGGNSVGGHSLTHPFITYFHSNRMFAEMSGVRIAWESALDKPVTSYAYSFVDLRPEPEGRDVLERTLESLARAGFYHLAEYVSFFDGVELEHELSPIMPPENRPFSEFTSAVNWAYNDEQLSQRHPMITNSMHAWYGTPRLHYGYDELRKRLDTLSNLDDVWHCNQNQYASYRRQFRFARLKGIQRQGNRVTATLTRPCIALLNDDTPLTLSVSCDAPASVVDVQCSDGEVTMSDRQLGDRRLFHVGHRRSDTLPEKIGHIANPDNKAEWRRLAPDVDFPGMLGAVYVEDEVLKLDLECAEGSEIDNVRVRWRVPIAYTVDQQVQRPAASPMRRLSLEQPLVRSSSHDACWGREHFAAQVDFRIGGQSGRMHLTCQRPGAEPDSSLPKDGFAILGPIPNDQLDLEAMIQQIQEHPSADNVRLSDDTVLTWRSQGQDGYVRHDWLNPEYVRTMGTWDAQSPTYILRSSVYSPENRKVRLQTSHPAHRTVLVNGRVCDSDTVNLRAGDNRIVVIYPGCTLGVETQRLTACFIRLSDPQTGQRLRDIQYRAL